MWCFQTNQPDSGPVAELMPRSAGSRRGSWEGEVPRCPGQHECGPTSDQPLHHQGRRGGRTGPEAAPDPDRDRQREGRGPVRSGNSKGKKWRLCSSGGAGPRLSLAHKNKVQMKVKSLSRVRLFAIPWTVARQAPLCMEFSRQEYWSGMPFPSPGGSSWPGDWTQVSGIAGRFFTVWASQKNRWTSSDLSCDGETQAPIRTRPGDIQRVSHKSQH